VQHEAGCEEADQGRETDLARGEAEREAFRWVAKYEQAFWEMAYARGDV